MTRYSPINGWPIAEDTDVVKQYPMTVDDPFKTALDKKVMAVFPTMADRDAAFPTPDQGQECWVEDIDQRQIFVGNFWGAIGGTMPRMEAHQNTNQYFGAGHSPVILGATSASAAGGWPVPTLTKLVLPVGHAYVVDYSISMYCVQPATIQLGWGSVTSVDEFGSTLNSPGDAQLHMSGAWVCNSGGEYCPWFYASIAVDAGQVKFRCQAKAIAALG